MVIDPKAIEQTEFATSFRGYDKPEVRRYLRRLARELETLQIELGQPGAAGDVDSPGQSDEDDATLWPAASEAASDPNAVEQGQNGDSEVNAFSGDDERFQALGDRIASLLQSAHVSAAQVREGAEAEAAQKIADAEMAQASIKSVAESNAEGIVAAARVEADEIKAAAVVEADRLKFSAEELHVAAELAAGEAAEAKESAVADGEKELKARHEELDALSLEAASDRDQAMSELGDARGQVAELLGQARSQSEFIRHEAEEVIRARVRRNMDQAEERLNQLRNSEVASRERILAAHRELAGAMARLDAEEAPQLPVDPESFAINGAGERAERSNFGEIEANYDDLDSAADAADADVRRATDNEVNELSAIDVGSEVELDVEPEQPDGDNSTPTAEVIEVEVLEPIDAEDVSKTFVDGAADEDSLADDDAADEAALVDEDALGRLVREAMEKAVDSARASDD